MEIRNHQILRQTSVSSSQRVFSTALESDLPTDTFHKTVPVEDDCPGISGLARFSRTRAVGVRDAKLESADKRLMLIHNASGEVEDLNVDWSKTGRPRDLEAITPGKGRNSYLAVEGSSFGEHKARLFDLKVTSKGGESRRSFQLPEFGQEIEGLLTVPNKDGSQTVLFGGRGDEKGTGRVYWGNLSEDGLNFSSEGLKGQQIEGPDLGPGRRSISDLAADNQGGVWATAAVDEGDDGPFTSAVYRIGNLSGNGSKPLELDFKSDGFTIPGTKAEALTFASDGSLVMGSDNESRGGRLESFSIIDRTV